MPKTDIQSSLTPSISLSTQTKPATSRTDRYRVYDAPDKVVLSSLSGHRRQGLEVLCDQSQAPNDFYNVGRFSDL